MALLLAIALVVGPPAEASHGPSGAGPGYFASPNVEWITTLPLETDTSGAKILDGYMYITTARWLAIYDITNPEAPARLGTLPLIIPQEPQFSEENVDSNGEILLVGSMGTLNVVDVRDKDAPVIIGTLDGADQHTISCVLDCTWAYGSDGIIVDLRDPTAPALAGNWGEGNPASGGHDVTEVSPGIVVTSSNPMMVLDARKDPANPKVLALGAPPDERFIHDNYWPRGGKDRFLLVGGESGGPSCGDEAAAAFMVWDTKGWKKKQTIRMIDEYRVTDGLPTDGNALVHTFCSHWTEPHPSFRNGGLVAKAWYEHGTRFLRVTEKGQIEEEGYFLPIAGATSAAYWVTDEIVYAVDYQRGVDILRFIGTP